MLVSSVLQCLYYCYKIIIIILQKTALSQGANENVWMEFEGKGQNNGVQGLYLQEADVVYEGILDVIAWARLDLSAVQYAYIQRFLIELESMSTTKDKYKPMREKIAENIRTFTNNLTHDDTFVLDVGALDRMPPELSELEYNKVTNMYLMVTHWFHNDKDAAEAMNATLKIFKLKDALESAKYPLARDILIDLLDAAAPDQPPPALSHRNNAEKTGSTAKSEGKPKKDRTHDVKRMTDEMPDEDDYVPNTDFADDDEIPNSGFANDDKIPNTGFANDDKIPNTDFTSYGPVRYIGFGSDDQVPYIDFPSDDHKLLPKLRSKQQKLPCLHGSTRMSVSEIPYIRRGARSKRPRSRNRTGGYAKRRMIRRRKQPKHLFGSRATKSKHQ